MAQEKIVDVELGSVFSGKPLVEKYTVKTASVGLEKINNVGMKPTLNIKETQFETPESALAFAKEKREDVANNLSIVANPYLIYTVKSEDNILHPCSSVYVKYGIVVPSTYFNKVPLIFPEKYTSIRYDADCSGLHEVAWLTPGNRPQIKFQVGVPDNVKLPSSWLGKSALYAFVDCVFFFEEPELARDFRDDMLIQQALRRYLFYKKVEKTW